MVPSLHTERLELREWRIEDAPAAFEMYRDPEVVRFLGKGLPTPDIDAQRLWLADRLEHYRKPALNGFGFWAIVEPSTGQVVGTTMLKPIPPTQDEIEIGWHLARRVWGRGYASEAAIVVLRYGFLDLKLDRILAVVHPANVRSMAVARRIGMRWECRTERYYEGDEDDLFIMDRDMFVAQT